MPRVNNKKHKNSKNISEQNTDEEKTDFISLRNIRMMFPLIDLCDFLALIIFEDNHPDLFVNSNEISVPSDKTQMILKNSLRLTAEQRKQMVLKTDEYKKQTSAFNRIWSHKKYGPELKEMIHEFREERKQARINDETSNRFINSRAYLNCLEEQYFINDIIQVCGLDEFSPK